MIHESAPWKEALLRDADILDRWCAKPKATERRSVLVEKKVFLAAYAIRKLHEAEKLSSSFDQRSVKCTVYPSTSEIASKANNHRVFDLYDLERGKRQTIAARRLLDLIIHSLIFAESLRDDHSLVALMITSDLSSQKGLWSVTVADFTALMRHVGTDYPAGAVWVRDPETGERRSWRGSETPPDVIREALRSMVRSK